MIKEYIAYLKDNPEKYWFKAKIFGWGWTPARWQGWIAILVYMILVLAVVLSREEYIPGNENSGSNILTFALPILLLTTALIIVCYKTGEKPHWQWGLPDKYKDKNE
jgi:hypothetical protein